MSNNTFIKTIPIFTFIVGFLSFLILSIHYGVFFLDSPYDVPLILNMSVMIGDSILLPIINYSVFNLYFNILGYRKPNISLNIWIAISFFFSAILNLYSHISWVNDKFSDFIGFQQGEFSIIGYWHLIFSIIQFLILLIYPFLWFQSISIRNETAILYSKKIWIYFFLFTSLGTFDMLNKYLFVYSDTLIQTIRNEGFPFLTIIISLILLLVMRILEVRKATPS